MEVLIVTDFKIVIKQKKLFYWKTKVLFKSNRINGVYLIMDEIINWYTFNKTINNIGIIDNRTIKN